MRCRSPTAEAPGCPLGPLNTPQPGLEGGTFHGAPLDLLISRPLGWSVETTHFILTTALQVGAISTSTLQPRKMRHGKGTSLA